MDWLIKDAKREVFEQLMLMEDDFGAGAFATAAVCNCKAATQVLDCWMLAQHQFTLEFDKFLKRIGQSDMDTL